MKRATLIITALLAGSITHASVPFPRVAAPPCPIRSPHAEGLAEPQEQTSSLVISSSNRRAVCDGQVMLQRLPVVRLWMSTGSSPRIRLPAAVVKMAGRRRNPNKQA